jgi:hypothetical protein
VTEIRGQTVRLGIEAPRPDGNVCAGRNKPGSPVTVAAGAAAASTTAIQSAVTKFVNAHNSIVDKSAWTAAPER